MHAQRLKLGGTEHPLFQFEGETRFADARFAGDEHETAALLAGERFDGVLEACHLLVTSNHGSGKPGDAAHAPRFAFDANHLINFYRLDPSFDPNGTKFAKFKKGTRLFI